MNTMPTPTSQDLGQNNSKKIPNPTNYKIVKCKNFEKGKIL